MYVIWSSHHFIIVVALDMHCNLWFLIIVDFFSNFSCAITLGWRPWFTYFPQLCSGSFFPTFPDRHPKAYISILFYVLHYDFASPYQCSYHYLFLITFCPFASTIVVALDMLCTLYFLLPVSHHNFTWFCSDMYLMISFHIFVSYYVSITTLQHHIHVPTTSCASDRHCSSAFLFQ